MKAVPEAAPLTMPPATVAAPLLLLHAPPEVASVNVTVPPMQILADVGDIAAGPATTVTVFVVKHDPTV